MNHVYGPDEIYRSMVRCSPLETWGPAKIEIQFWTPRSFPKDEMTAECDVLFFAWFISGFNHYKLLFCELR